MARQQTDEDEEGLILFHEVQRLEIRGQLQGTDFLRVDLRIVF